MARSLRIEYPGALYHVTARGNAGGDVFLEDGDRTSFLAVVGKVVERFGWIVHAYCLMGNHYHLLVETPEPNLSRGMRHLGGVYTQRFNAHHQRFGHLFQGRYKAILVEREAYLLELCRYLVLNPVRAGMTRAAGGWRWSNFRATASRVKAPPWLETQWTLDRFGADAEVARRAYTRFVADGKGADPWADLRKRIFLGSEAFVDRHLGMIEGGGGSGEIPKAQRRRAARRLEEYASEAPDRDAAIREAWRSGAHTLAEIGAHFGLHYSRISRIARAKGKT